MISCILISSRSHERLNEAIEGFLTQNFTGKSELLLYNDSQRKLKGAFNNTRIFNLARPVSQSAAMNFLVSQSKYEWVVSLGENEILLPNHLQNLASGIKTDSAWVWLAQEFIHERGRINRIAQGSTSSFMFSKTAWLKAGKYRMNNAAERYFIGEVTKRCPGEKVNLDDSAISLIRREQIIGMKRFLSGDVQLKPAFKEDYAGMVRKYLERRAENRCCVVLLAKYGDIINILPVLKRMSEQGVKVTLMVHASFASLLEGVSYVTPKVVTFDANSVSTALAIAKSEFEVVFNAQIWGKGLKLKRECDSFNLEAWRSMGMEEHFDDKSMKPLFDRRDLDREAKLIADHIPPDKPYILVNFKSQTSPCPACAGLLEAIQERWGDLFSVIDLAKITAHRLYDFIGMMEKASALVTVDTAFLHLAAATNVPIVALCNPRPWLGSTPRGNVVARLTYTDVAKDYEITQSALGKAISMSHG